MLDLKLVREDPEAVRAALARRGAADAVDQLLELDARRRELLPQVEGQRAEQNRAGQAIAEGIYRNRPVALVIDSDHTDTNGAWRLRIAGILKIALFFFNGLAAGRGLRHHRH